MRETRLTDAFPVSAIGLGCSPMSHGYSPRERDDAESIRVIHRALDLGVTLFDTADVYGPFDNEELLGRALGPHRHEVRVATKCGLVAGADGKLRRNGRPEYLRAACEGSLRRLGVEAVDLYQLHRIDPEVPLDDTWGALADLVTEGKVRALGISHATLDELEYMHALFPITAVQYELSVFATRSRDELLPWCRKHGVGFLAFAPVGRGYLSGKLPFSALRKDDSRSRDPRFAPEALRLNRAIVNGLRTIGARLDATAAQVAIAWVLAQAEFIVPIPGTRHQHHLEENVAAAELKLSADDLRQIAELPTPVGEMSWDTMRTARTDEGTRVS
jgi:aryl-alcohol dehydrogenase-like predicted oxidoreductase